MCSYIVMYNYNSKQRFSVWCHLLNRTVISLCYFFAVIILTTVAFLFLSCLYYTVLYDTDVQNVSAFK